ncbi:hypothetical protein OKW22_000607 [Bacilli bacterium PM5-3]|nr:hypothetical protein [Bacilli bacterium PM5-3]MDH6603863.1 hypothetical protein [Bacilli bacterium PM5-9]
MRDETNNVENKKKWFIDLSEEDGEFIKKFVIYSGSLKKLSQVYNVSYPTVRIRLDNLIEKISHENTDTELEYINFIKDVMSEYEVSSKATKKLIKKYIEMSGKNNE